MDPLLKVSIVPRGAGALGYAQYVPREQFLKTTDDLKDTLCLALGGKVAEQLFGFGASSGAQNDLERVTQIAQGMVSTYGMNDRIGLVAYPSQDGTQFNKPYGEETARMIDEEVGKIIKEAHDRTTALLTERKSEVETIALLLLDKEKITAEDVQKAINDRKPDFAAYVEPQKARADIVVQVLLSDIVDDPTGKFLKVKLIQKKSLDVVSPSFMFDEGSTITWTPNKDKLTTSGAGVLFKNYEDDWFGELALFFPNSIRTATVRCEVHAEFLDTFDHLADFGGIRDKIMLRRISKSVQRLLQLQPRRKVLCSKRWMTRRSSSSNMK